MNHKKSIYGIHLKFNVVALIAILLCGLVFIGFTESEEMIDVVITPSEDTPPGS